MLKYTENENLKPQYFNHHHKRLITFFATSKKKSTESEVSKEIAITKAPFTFIIFLKN